MKNKKSLKDEIIRLKNEGFSYSEIQKKLNCSKGTISYHLGVGQKDKTINRTKSARTKIKQFIQEYKSNKKCADCGEDYPYWIMEFDHLRDKKFTIGRYNLKTISLDVIKEEVLKCDVVCANCHRNRTFNRMTKHGSHIGWENLNYKD
jgi:hypothetical protein